jgi:hypothetical protein
MNRPSDTSHRIRTDHPLNRPIAQYIGRVIEELEQYSEPVVRQANTTIAPDLDPT